MRYEAAYARQSVEKKNSLSIKGQLDLCTRTSGNSSLLMYSDQGYSGKNTDRPDFQRLLKDIKADKISKLYVYRLDRFSRSNFSALSGFEPLLAKLFMVYRQIGWPFPRRGPLMWISCSLQYLRFSLVRKIVSASTRAG